MKRSGRLLIVAAHPDDEILGCGATAAKLVKSGHEAYTLILGEGVTSRDRKREKAKRTKELSELKEHIYRANKIIGIKDVFIHDFPDNRFDSVSILDIVKVIEKVKDRIRPDMIFTHYERDLNIDHQITCKAVLTATRPLPDETVKEVYSFEILSSTEWNYPLSFSPDVYFDITETIDLKTKAISEYRSEIKEYPHPRSLEGVRINAEYRGMNVGLKYAEAFKSIRIIK